MVAENPREVVDELNRLVVVDERGVALLAEAGEGGDADIRHAPVQRVVARDVDAELLDDVLHVRARRDVAVLQLPESDPQVVELVRANRLRVAQHHLLHVGIGVAPHVRNGEGIVPELVRDAVAEEPVHRRALGVIDAIGVLVRVDFARLAVHEVGAGPFLVGSRVVPEKLLRGRVDAVGRNPVARERGRGDRRRSRPHRTRLSRDRR